jgi:hypothetical protein
MREIKRLLTSRPGRKATSKGSFCGCVSPPRPAFTWDGCVRLGRGAGQGRRDEAMGIGRAAFPDARAIDYEIFRRCDRPPFAFIGELLSRR